MKKVTVTLFSLCLSFMAQTQVLDSLIRVASLFSDDSARAMLHCEIAMKLYYNDPDSARVFINMAMETGKSINDDAIIAKSNNILGIIFDITNKWDSALICYDKAVEFAKRSNSTNTRASALNNIGLIYWNKGEFDLAVEYFNRSLILFEEIDFQRGIANTFNNIGLIYYQQKRYNKAISYHLKALEKRLEIDDQYGIGASYSNLALAYDDLEIFDSVYYYSYLSIANKELIGDKYGLAITYNNLAATYQYQDIYDSAIMYYVKSVKKYRELDNMGRCASSLYNLGELYRQYNKYRNAEKVYFEAMNYAEEADAKNLLYKIYAGISVLKEKSGDYKTAYEFLEKRNEIHDSIYKVEKDEKIAMIQEKYESEKKDKELALLSEKKAQAELKVSNRNKWIAALGAGTVSIVLLALLLIQRGKRKAQQEKDKAIIAEKESGIEAVIAAQENERRKIARDLHDGIVQQLGAIILAWRKLISGSGMKKEKDLELLNLLENSSEELRGISHQMMPKALSELGIIAALEDLLDKSFKGSSVDFEFDSFGIEKRLGEILEVTIFRVSQEIIQNILKHSKATKVFVQLYQTGNQVILSIEDNGIGFDHKLAKGGIGLQNIKSRLDIVKGSVSFEYPAGSGTLVLVKIPVKYD